MSKALSITTGIVDPDHKGTTGRGTVYWMEIVFGDEKHKYEWGLLEELSGTFKPDEVKAPFKQWAREQQDLADLQEQNRKKQVLHERAQAASLPSEVQDLISGLLAENQSVVDQFKSGNTKALNALVGKAIGKAKQLGFSCDAFAINLFITRQIG